MMNSTKCVQKKNSRASRGPGRIGSWTGLADPLPLRHSDQLDVHHSPNSEIWTCRIRRVRNSPMSDVMNAKWHEGTSTRVSINPNQKHVLKIVS